RSFRATKRTATRATHDRAAATKAPTFATRTPAAGAPLSSLPLLLRVWIGSLKFGPKANRLAQAHVQCELRGTAAEVGRNNCLSWNGRRIKRAKAGLHNAGTREVRGKGRTIIEDGVAIQVSSGSDIERSA